MIVWGFLVLGCALLASAVLLRRWPLAALAVVLGGSVASMVLQPRPSTQLITAGDARSRVLVLTTFDDDDFDDDDYVYGALRAGASGFLVKDMALEDILTAIRVVAGGDAIIAPGVTRRLIAQFASQPRSGGGPSELTGITDREREVLTGLVQA
jgi:DNA-binding NarL/FixJ family response regulator